MKEKLKRIIAFILLLSMLPSINIFADSIEEVFYKDMVKKVEEMSGEKVLAPTIDFNLKLTDPNNKVDNIPASVNDGMKFDNLANPGMAAYEVPISIKVPIGTKIEGFDLSSSKYPDKEITMWDWQMSYMDKSGKRIEGDQYKTKDISMIADKEGYILFFLNVADNKNFYYEGTHQKIVYNNWSTEGNWKTEGMELNENFNVWKRRV